jgi:hypothetical protein
LGAKLHKLCLNSFSWSKNAAKSGI